MTTGFSVTGSASAVLFGLVLVSLTFGYNAALSRFDRLGDCRGFVEWFWAAGFSTCIYFSFLVRYTFGVLMGLTSVDGRRSNEGVSSVRARVGGNGH